MLTSTRRANCRSTGGNKKTRTSSAVTGSKTEFALNLNFFAAPSETERFNFVTVPRAVANDVKRGVIEVDDFRPVLHLQIAARRSAARTRRASYPWLVPLQGIFANVDISGGPHLVHDVGGEVAARQAAQGGTAVRSAAARTAAGSEVAVRNDGDYFDSVSSNAREHAPIFNDVGSRHGSFVDAAS